MNYIELNTALGSHINSNRKLVTIKQHLRQARNTVFKVRKYLRSCLFLYLLYRSAYLAKLFSRPQILK